MILDDELIDDYLLGRLSHETTLKLEAELARHPEYRARVQAWKALRHLVREAAPVVPSERLWARIAQEIRKPQPSKAGIWESLLEALASPRPRYALAAVALLLCVGVVSLLHRPELPSPSPAPLLSSNLVPSSKPKPTPSRLPQPQSVVAALPHTANSPTPHQQTEVERALSDQSNDEVLAAMIREHDSQTPEASSEQFMPSAPMAMANAGSGAAPVAFETAEIDNSAPSAIPALPSAQSRTSGGLWDFRQVAQDLNRRDWPNANAELHAAATEAPQEAERSFAKASLYLLAQAGQPVSSVDPSESSSFAVESAGQWQLYAENQVVHYLNGVSARIPGYRSEGQGLSIGFAGNRAFFGVGTHFVGVQDDRPCTVRDAKGQLVTSGDFIASQGADYNFTTRVLQLK